MNNTCERRRKIGMPFLSCYAIARSPNIHWQTAKPGFYFDEATQRICYVTRKYVYDLYQPGYWRDKIFIYEKHYVSGIRFSDHHRIRIKP